MIFKEYIEKLGKIFFRWRSFWPFILLPFLFIAIKLCKNYEKGAFSIYFLISIFGILIRCLVIGYAPQGTSGRGSNLEAETLNTKGLYSVIRHPIYLGNFFIFLGIVLFTKVWWFIIISLILFYFYYTSIIMAEEKFLKEKFGEKFLKYYQNTPAIIPKFKNWQKPTLPFSFKNVMRREFHTFFGLVVGFTFIDFLKQIFINNKLEDLFLIKFFLFNLLIYLMLYILSNKTKIFYVENR